MEGREPCANRETIGLSSESVRVITRLVRSVLNLKWTFILSSRRAQSRNPLALLDHSVRVLLPKRGGVGVPMVVVLPIVLEVRVRGVVNWVC